MTRIIGGVAKGRSIRTPPGDATRPTADRVREALFSSLDSMLGTVHGVAFLDLYAGSGAVGLEAASRGAGHVLAVERNRAAAALIRSNAARLGLHQVDVLVGSASTMGERDGRTCFQAVFLDPPYDVEEALIGDVLARLAAGRWLVAGAVAAVERSRRTGALTWPDGFEALRERRYGDTIVWYGRWEAPTRESLGASRSDEEG